MTDIEIAQSTAMEPVADVARSIGLAAEDLELYGQYKAKISMQKLRALQAQAADPAKRGKLVLVTGKASPR